MKKTLLMLSIFVFFISCQNEHQVRFALFTDTHVAENTTGAEDLQLAVNDINQRNDIDFVLVSGDITDLNISDNLENAKNILDKLASTDINNLTPIEAINLLNQIKNDIEKD